MAGTAFVGAVPVTRRGAWAGAAVCRAGARNAAVARRAAALKMAISEGERIPFQGSFMVLGQDDMSVEKLFKDRKVAVVAIPGAFTGTCFKQHVPAFVANADKLKAQGVDEVVCIAVNDPFVMSEFGKALGAEGKVTMLADGDASFAKRVGLTKDTGAFGGLRSARYSMLVSNGVVVKLNVDAGGLDKSQAEILLEQLGESMDPLEKYCRDAPEADECRVYED
uniref:Thioredoxin domain-containing protein n=1 Tax=Erythrolobus australicus TaxID=1077150 RepID=A0A7S1XJA3_9RHOD|mmetsp:Transcript_5001/g.13479  ORF Transcript_5001/g.13479 Transcript_5001/m.13479 type:complete len:223 (+) Transcript_5001:110-778(+)